VGGGIYRSEKAALRPLSWMAEAMTYNRSRAATAELFTTAQTIRGERSMAQIKKTRAYLKANIETVVATYCSKSRGDARHGT
jgi:hypothetical protein